MRLFVAIDIPESLKEEINNFIFSNYRLVDKNKINWVKKENLHITLKFIGEIDKELLPKVEERLSFCSKDKRWFKVKLEGVGVFPKINSARVLWIGVKEEENYIFDLAQRIEDELAKLNIEKEKREFRTHLTVGRIKVLRDRESIDSFVKKFSKKSFGVFEVDGFVLYESVLKSEGAEYSVVKKFSFSK